MADLLRIIPTVHDNPRPLGRHVEHDDRSWDHPFDADLSAPPKPVIWPHHGDVLDQGQIGSCTGNALVQCLATGPLMRADYRPTEDDAVRMYELATQRFDNIPGSYPPTDTGSSGLGVCKAARHMGTITAYKHAFSIGHAKATIQQTPIMVGTVWFDQMFTPDPEGIVRPTGNIAGGHEYVAIGYDPGPDLWTFLNSWGPSFGIAIPDVAPGGLFRMGGPDFATLLAHHGDLTIPIR